MIVLIDDKLVGGPAGLTPDRFAPENDLRQVSTHAGRDEVRRALADADIIVTALEPVTAWMMDAAPRLGLIAKPGVGVDNIDIRAATARNVVVCNAPGVRGRSVAEHTMFMILHLARCGWIGYGHPRGERQAFDLADRTLGLLGFGDIGRRVAEMARAFDMRIVASTPSRNAHGSNVPVSFLDPPQLLLQSDVLVLCAPLTGETRGFIDRDALRRLRTDAILVNVARGPCVVTEDLTEAMGDGHLHGAGLDVTDPEPLPAQHPLRDLPNVLITPHVGGWSITAQRAAIDRMVGNIEAHLRGELPRDALSAPLT